MNDSSGGTSRGLSASCTSNSNPANLVHPQMHPANVTTVQPQPQNLNKSGNFAYATARSIGDSATISLLASTSAGNASNSPNFSSTGIVHENQIGNNSGLHSNATVTNTNRAPEAGQASANTNLARKVFIQRDYSEGTAVRFQTKFPPELEGYIEWQHFDYLITTLNCYYDKAEAANSSTFCEGCCACCTAYLVYICLETHYEKYMRKTKAFIDEQNEKIWKPRGLIVTDPLERGLRIIEITIGPRAQQRDLPSEPIHRRS